MDEDWEQEKARRIPELQKTQQYVNQLGLWLTQCGVQPPPTYHGKLDAILEMLVELDLVTERQVMDMEKKFADKIVTQLEEYVSSVRVQALKLGAKLPPMPTQSGIITP